jgi:DNA-directed RNA polymerase specialized sigma24 family protein
MITDRQSMTSLLESHYPRVWRLARGLCGDAAQSVAKTVLTQSLFIFRRWRNDLEAENWYLHHTVLESRRFPSANTSLIPAASPPDLLAFAQSLASLPFQQREAFILTHGEHLDLRRTAVAMDCSQTAAGTHLNAATLTLRKLTAHDYARLVAELFAAYESPPPPGDLVIAYAAKKASRVALWRFTAKIAVIFLLIALAWAAWKIWPLLDY